MRFHVSRCLAFFFVFFFCFVLFGRYENYSSSYVDSLKGGTGGRRGGVGGGWGEEKR